MKNKEIIRLHQNLTNGKLNNLSGVKLLYAIDRNLSRLVNEVKSLEKSIEKKEGYLEYDKERIQLNEEYAERQPGGKPKTQQINTQVFEYIINKDRSKEYEKKMDQLNKKYSDAIEVRKKDLDEYELLLEQESGFQPYEIEVASLPEDIKWEQYQVLHELIKKED